MAVALHVAADDRAVEHVERGEQRGGAVALVVVGHGAGAALLHRQARLGAVERLDLALLVDRQHDGMGRRIDIEADDVVELLGEGRVVGQLEGAPAMRREAVGVPDLHDRGRGDAGRLGHRAPRPVGRLVRRRLERQRDDLGRPLGASGALPGGRVLSRSSPSTPSAMKRSCQRQTQVLDLPVAAMIAEVPRPSAVSRMIRARQTCFCGELAIRDDRLKPIDGPRP